MTDEQLLTMFRKYKKKRNIIIISILVIIISSIFIFLSISNTSSKNDAKSKEITNVSKEKDEIAPVIKLNTNYIEIIEGGDVDYLKYIESVIDDKDGDLLESITYNEIDTTKIGEQKIVYTVSDSSGNTSQEVVVVNVLKKEEQQPSNSASNNTTTKPEPPSNDPVEDIPSTKKIIKYFLFKDGYTMQNVSEACATELKKTNRTGICSPIQDEDGIYLGMKLETN